jgi:hypothetical protein
MTILIDDAGTGDILFGVVIGGYSTKKDHFVYDVIDVRYFQEPIYKEKRHLNEAKRITLSLIERLGLDENEKIVICTADIFNSSVETLIEIYGEDRVERGKVEDKAQILSEQAFEDELRNLGYEVIKNRTEKWGKNFWHMYNWLKKKPERLRWAKSAFPNLKKYPLFSNS